MKLLTKFFEYNECSRFWTLLKYGKPIHTSRAIELLYISTAMCLLLWSVTKNIGYLV